eukprot:185505_1
MTTRLRAVKALLIIESDIFEANLDNNKDWFPVKGGKMVNITTKEIVDRTDQDYFSFEADGMYRPELSGRNNNRNKFMKFIKTLWLVNLFIIFIRLLIGYWCSSYNDEDTLAFMTHWMGRNGKGILIGCINKVIPAPIVQVVNAKLLLKNDNNEYCNFESEMNVLRRTRLAVIDETKKSSKLEVNRAKFVSGRGRGNFRDCNQKGGEVDGLISYHKFLIMGQHRPQIPLPVDRALEPRLIDIVMTKYFRNPGEPGYNPNDLDNCLPRDVGLVDELEEKSKDHIVTVLVYCMDDYKQMRLRGENIFQHIPIQWKINIPDPLLDFVNMYCDEGEYYKVSTDDFLRKYNEVTNIEINNSVRRDIYRRLKDEKNIEKKHCNITVKQSLFGIRLKLN